MKNMSPSLTWIRVVTVVGVSLTLLFLSTATSSSLSFSFNTNLFHFLDFKGESHCPPVKEGDRQVTTEDWGQSSLVSSYIIMENKTAPPENSPHRENLPRLSEAEDALARGFPTWWQTQLERKALVAEVCAR